MQLKLERFANKRRISRCSQQVANRANLLSVALLQPPFEHLARAIGWKGGFVPDTSMLFDQKVEIGPAELRRQAEAAAQHGGEARAECMCRVAQVEHRVAEAGHQADSRGLAGPRIGGDQLRKLGDDPSSSFSRTLRYGAPLT